MTDSPNDSPLRPPNPPHTPPPAGYPAPAEPLLPRPDAAGNWVGAVFAALAVQFVAAVVAMVATAILFIGAFSTFGDQDANAPGWILLCIPVGVASVALYISSGLVASRIARDNRGWLMLIGGPIVFGFLRIVFIVLTEVGR